MPGIQRGRIRYYVTSSRDRGAKDCEARGWTAASYFDFYSAPGDMVHLVWNFSEFRPAMYGGKAKMIRGEGYEEGRDREDFDAFVRDGHGEWVE